MNNIRLHIALLAAFFAALMVLKLYWKLKPTAFPRLLKYRPGFSQFTLAVGVLLMLVAVQAGLSCLEAPGVSLAVAALLSDEEFQQKVLSGLKGNTEKLGLVETQLTEKQKAIDDLKTKINEQHTAFTGLQKQFLQRGFLGGNGPRRRGMVTDACARALGSQMILLHARSGALDIIDEPIRGKLFDQARSALGIETKAALTTTDIPLPSEFYSEIRELISEFGVARKYLMMFPIGRGTARPPRFKTRPAFGSIAMSAAFTEKSPQIDFASLESHKVGGIVRVPRELDEQSIVPMGQFLARYGAIEFARAEDTWAFLADGTATYESVKGITKICVDNAKNTVGAAGGIPSATTVAQYRGLRAFVNAAALSQGAAYFFHSTMEVHLRSLNTAADPYFFVHNNTPNRELIPVSTLDGFPIIWTDVLQPYSTGAALNKFVSLFGVPQYWWFGEHGSPRLDLSSDVYFTTDELGARFIEEIDFDYQALDAFGSLQMAAA